MTEVRAEFGDRLEAEVVKECLTGFETGSGRKTVYNRANADYFEATASTASPTG